MAVTHWMTGEATQTTACVVVRDSTTRNVPVVANGVTLQAACNTAVNDGNARVDFTGLQPGQTYNYTVDGAAGGTLRTAPPAGAYPYWIAASSCWAIGGPDNFARRLLDSPPASLTGRSYDLMRELVANLRGVFGLGDLLYKNISGATNGYTLTPIQGGTLATALVTENHLQYWRSQGQVYGLRDLARKVPFYKLKDDHEYDPNDATYSLEWMDKVFPATAPNTQGNLDALWAISRSTWDAWALGNPAKTLTTCAYFTQRIGDVEIFCTDLIDERDWQGDTDGPNKRLISDEQENALLNGLAASTATYKMWLSSKMFVASVGHNADGWCNLSPAAPDGKGYETQLLRILADPRFPRAGCLSLTGDEHLAADMFLAGDHFGGSHAAISQISAGPATIGVLLNPEDGMTYRKGVVKKERDTSDRDGQVYGEKSYVCLRVLADRIERYRLSNRYGLVYEGYVGPADNLVRR